MQATISTPGRDKFQKLLSEYVRVNKRDNIELVTRKARTATYEFYRATLAATPTPQQIKQAVTALGWRVRRKPGAWPLRRGEKCGSTGPLRRMQAAQIGRRTKAIGVASTGWLPAVNRLGGSVARSKRLADVSKPKGSIILERTGNTQFRITVVNATPGIVAMDRKYHLIDQGFEKASKDIEKYLNAKRAGASGATVGGN